MNDQSAYVLSVTLVSIMTHIMLYSIVRSVIEKAWPEKGHKDL